MRWSRSAFQVLMVGLIVAGFLTGKARSPPHIRTMWKSDIICPECSAGYRRVVITSCEGVKGEYRCLNCNQVLEAFDGSFAVLIRLTVPPEKTQ
jgi:DNA-directed RNA polymerase subunit RPC12/RpoP